MNVVPCTSCGVAIEVGDDATVDDMVCDGCFDVTVSLDTYKQSELQREEVVATDRTQRDFDTVWEGLDN